MTNELTEKSRTGAPTVSKVDTRQIVRPGVLSDEEVQAFKDTVYTPDPENLDHLYD